MATKTKKAKKDAQNPLILRCHRLMDAFAKSDDERDFYLDKTEGFIVFVDLDKTEEELNTLLKELDKSAERYVPIPKFSFFESKKIMEGFVHEKVYDIDTKEKLLDIIQSKEAREHFLEFIYDHHSELEKWQQYYQERSRVRIIEWLRNNHFNFVFEEDLDFSTSLIEKVKKNLFEKKVGKDVDVARKAMMQKAKTYYSNEALNPRPKRGRPPKQQQKLEVETQVTSDIYTTVPSPVRTFLYTPDITSMLDVTFSAKYESREELMANLKQGEVEGFEESMQSISQKLASLRELSSKWLEKEEPSELEEEPVEEAFEYFAKEDEELFKKLEERKKAKPAKAVETKKKPIKKKEVKPLKVKKAATKKKTPAKRIIPKAKPKAKAKAKPKAAAKAKPKAKTPAKRPVRKITPAKKPAAKKNAAPKKKAPAKKTTKAKKGKK